MELKVWVEGIQRIVCGVTETTTCQVSFSLLYLACWLTRFCEFETKYLLVYKIYTYPINHLIRSDILNELKIQLNEPK